MAPGDLELGIQQHGVPRTGFVLQCLTSGTNLCCVRVLFSGTFQGASESELSPDVGLSATVTLILVHDEPVLICAHGNWFGGT